MENLVSIHDIGRTEIEAIIDKAVKIQELDRKDQLEILPGRVLATAFFEPSTRTRISFQTAVQRLGGSSINLDQKSSSLKKGETMYDTVKVLSKYSDIVVLRSPYEGSARMIADNTDVPVVNGGDGTNQHPTQTLLDFFTIKQEKGKIDGLKIGLMGDLKYGRTTHSLVEALKDYSVEIRLIAPEKLQMPEEITSDIKVERIEEMKIKDLDVLYATRIQEERFSDRKEYEKMKGIYELDARKVSKMDESSILMHPLPRVNEIKPEVDELPQSVYFKQAGNGVPVRMALIAELLEADIK